MYSDTAIQSLTNRGAWAAPVPPTNKSLTAENAVSSNGRLFTSFHSLCTVENVEAHMIISSAASGYEELVTNEQLNNKLTEIRDQAARKVLSRVFDTNGSAQVTRTAFGYRRYSGGYDYTVTITTRIANLDDCFGYQVAYDTLELMLTTQRSNHKERGSAQAGAIMAAQRGYRNAEGQLIEDGILQKLENAYQTAISLFFAGSRNRNVYDASNRW